MFAISKSLNKVIFSSDAEKFDENKFYLFKPKVPFNEKYLKYFFGTQAWDQWVKTHESTGIAKLISRYDLTRKRIFFPQLDNQKKMADLLEDLQTWQNRIDTLRADLWIDPYKDLQQEQFKLPIQQNVITQLIDLMPHPLANILHHYRSIDEGNFKERYEILLKMIENFAVIISSISIGCIEKDFNEDEVEIFLAKQKQYLKNATFGTWVSLTKIANEKYKKDKVHSSFLILKNIFNDDLLRIFEDAKNIRNSSLGHGSHPTKATARSRFMEVEKNFNKLMIHLNEIFSNYSLIRPLGSEWNGAKHKTKCNEFSGLGANPFGNIHIETKEPLISGELYLISKNNAEQNTKLFPFIRLIDIDHEYGIEYFYFYSQLEEMPLPLTTKRFLYISHQQIAKQSQFYAHSKIEKLFQ